MACLQVKTSRSGCGRGIVVVTASFLVLFLISFMVRCTGVLYVSWQNAFDASAVQTGVISSIISSSSFFGSILSGAVCNRFGYSLSCITGGFLMSFAMFMSFWASRLIHMYTAAVFIGYGTSLCYMAATVAVAHYFKTTYAIFGSFVAAGVSTSQVVSPPLFYLLLDAYGWRGTVLVAAAICANLCVVGALYRPVSLMPVGNNTSRETDSAGSTCDQSTSEEISLEDHNVQQVRNINRTSVLLPTLLRRVSSVFRLELLLQSYRYALLCLNCLELQMIYSCITIFLVPRAHFCGVDELNASFLLSVFGFGSLGARLSIGFFVTRKTPVEALYTFSLVLCCVGLLCSQAETYESFAASACIIGISIGAAEPLQNVLLRDFLGKSQVASGQGIFLIFGGVGDLIGPVVAGSIYDRTGTFSTVFYVLAGLIAATALQTLLLPVLRRLEPGVAKEDERGTGRLPKNV